MSYRMDMNPPIWRATLSGSLKNPDLLALSKKVLDLRRDDPIDTHNGLVDLRALSHIDIDFNTVSKVTTDIEGCPLTDNMRIAILARKPEQHGFARMLQAILKHEQIDIQIFYEDEQDALRWISTK